ncbi:DNA helicase RecQ [uncultured Clostridium sp.]|uniref:DNA helicase RecQ n=1 Tax=uncultured Clostridium sp. TaxID=59620 RepID=UPI002610A0D9|nr:DNA helicase RecQ [uncultured Clostridium sp.]
MILKAKNLLEKIYGYKDFKKGQEEIIKSVLDRRDTLGVMPTGGGKSVCYQIPALVLDGITIVISPLISLMKDQVDTLNEIGINSAFLNSTLSAIEQEEILFRIRNNDLKLLYIAPERLNSMELINVLNSIKVAQVAIDEAHCVSQWGHDFRTSYKNIVPFIYKLNERPVITAFTATASSAVRDDILNILGLIEPNVFVTGFDRENIEIEVLKGVDKKSYVLEYIKENISESGIIYASTRKEVELMWAFLMKNNIPTLKYHAGLSDQERRQNQEDFIFDKVSIMVATNAFGMGIDKPNVRFVIHYAMPQSIEAYYQEIGRAGRDGEKSKAILLFSSADVQTQKYLIDISVLNFDRKEESFKKLQKMLDYVYSNGCYRAYILNHFGEEANEKCDNCSNCLVEGEEIDRTLEAQKVLSCVYRMKRPYGVGVIVDVLRGSKVKKILDLGFNTVSTYGLMREYTKDDLKEFINTLISHGYLSMTPSEYPTIFVNQTSMDILKGNKLVVFKEVKIRRNIEKENELYTILKEIRYEISIEKGIPPYAIFGDSSLKEMSIRYPRTKEEFISVQGVGEKRYENYGERFIDIIKEYVSDNDIKVEVTIGTKTAVKKELDSMPLDVISNNELLEKLLEVRDTLAKKENTYKSYILPLNSLKEMSGRFPKDTDEFTDISGVGPKKVENYASAFLDVVNAYILENNISTQWIEKKRRKVVIDGETRTAKEITIDELKNKTALDDISKILELSISTILGYVTEYIMDGNEYTFELNLEKYYSDSEEQAIMTACDKLGIDNIAKLKKELPREFRYESIRAIILNKYILNV